MAGQRLIEMHGLRSLVGESVAQSFDEVESLIASHATKEVPASATVHQLTTNVCNNGLYF